MGASIRWNVVAPPASAFLLFVAIAAVSLRRGPVRTSRAPLVTGWGPLLRRLATTALGGYAVFLGIVLVFHVLIAGQRGAMRHAVAGGALLAFGVAIPALAILSRLELALRRRRPPPR